MLRILGCVLIIFALADLASPCSMIQRSLPGAFADDGSVVFAVGSEDEDRPTFQRLEFYSDAGRPVHSVEVEIDAPEATVRPLDVDEESRVWLRVSCYGGFEGQDCNSLLWISPQGEVLERRAIPAEKYRYGSRFQTGSLESDGWVFHELGKKPTASATRFKRPEDVCPECELERWVQGAGGSALFAVESHDEVHLVRFDARGEEIYRRSYPRAAPMRPASAENVRLGPIGLLHLGEDGAVYFGQYAYAADCETYQPPSLAILDPSGELVGIVRTPASVAAVAPLAQELLVLTNDGRVLRLGLDGTEIESWRPELAHWREAPMDFESMKVEAQAVDRSAAPEDWIRLYRWADAGKRQQMGAWLAEIGPGVFELLPDSLFQQQASELCRAYPETAAAEALRRFERSVGRNRDLWLKPLTECFTAPPPIAYDYAVSRQESSFYEPRDALRAWGPPPKMIEDLWLQAMGERPEMASQELAKLFPQQREAYEERLFSGPENERRRVRQLLLETAIKWHGPDAYELGPHADLLAAASEWQASSDSFVAVTGRLMRLGHGDLAVAEVLETVLRDAVEDPSVAPWVGAALGIASDHGTDLEEWPNTTLDALIEIGLTTPWVERRLDWGKVDNFHWLWHSDNPRVLQALLEQAADGPHAGAARHRLVAVATESPCYFEPTFLRSLIDSDWIATPRLYSWPSVQAFFESLGDAAYSLETPLMAALSERYRAVFLALAREAAGRGQAERFMPPAWSVSPRLLATLLSPQDVTALVGMSREGLRPWLPAAALVGVERSLAGELEILLENEKIPERLLAAVALGFLGHEEAQGVLVEEGMRGWFPFPAEALAPFSDDLRRQLEAIVLGPASRQRGAALQALRVVGPSRATLDKLAPLAHAALEGGEFPDVDLVRLLHEHGRPIFSDVLELLLGNPDVGWGINGRREFVLVFREWIEQDPRRVERVSDRLGKLDPGLSLAALRWRAELRQLPQPKGP